MKVAR